MGQKVHPIGFRLGVTSKSGRASGTPIKDYTELLQEDLSIRQADQRRACATPASRASTSSARRTR